MLKDGLVWSCSPRDSQESSPISQFKSINSSALSLLYGPISYPYLTNGKTIALTGQTFVGKAMSLLFNMLSRLVIVFLLRSKLLLISWLHSTSAVILGPKKIKSVTVYIVTGWMDHCHWSILHMVYSAYKLNKQGDNIQPWCTPFPNLNQSVTPCPILFTASWSVYRFLRRQVRCSGIPISLRIFQFVVIHIVKGFSIVNEAEVDDFWKSLAFSVIQQMLPIWSLVSLPFLNPAFMSESSWFTYCCRLAWKI